MNARGNQPQPEVLLVEDHDGARNAMTQLLTMHGFKVSPAATVQEGLARLNGQAFGILDLHLPDGLGLTILRKVRENKSSMKVAVCSGSTDPELILAVRRERPDRIFSKPLNFMELRDWMLKADSASAGR